MSSSVRLSGVAAFSHACSVIGSGPPGEICPQLFNKYPGGRFQRDSASRLATNSKPGGQFARTRMKRPTCSTKLRSPFRSLRATTQSTVAAGILF